MCFVDNEKNMSSESCFGLDIPGVGVVGEMLKKGIEGRLSLSVPVSCVIYVSRKDEERIGGWPSASGVDIWSGRSPPSAPSTQWDVLLCIERG